MKVVRFLRATALDDGRAVGAARDLTGGTYYVTNKQATELCADGGPAVLVRDASDFEVQQMRNGGYDLPVDA